MEEVEKDESFRDAISTVDKEGKRIWIYPKKPKGKYYNWRTIVSVGLIAALVGVPFVRIGGEPLLLLDVLNRKFIIFGQIFWPQDSHLFALGLIAIVLFIILFTVVYGRVFCGWVCPQTIFMEMVFRKIEYLIEGDWLAQKKLAKAPWNQEKIIKKTSKHLIFYALSFLIANVFLAYFIGTEALIELVTDPPSEHVAGLSIMMIFSGAFYFVFAKLREQVCTTICPYGRLQGVLLGRNSIVVAYDYLRGEKRGRLKKGQDKEVAGLGDCVDCKQCVHVCPTGIDIRNGTQLECVNCTACMDACDKVMLKLDRPTGLIKYASEESIATRSPYQFSTRSLGYTAVLFVLVGAIVTLLVTRTDVETTILRTPGILYQTQEDGRISNLYNMKIINKTNNDMELDIKLEDGLDGEIKLVGGGLSVKSQGVEDRALFIILDKKDLHKMTTKIKVGIYSNGEQIETASTNFLGPTH